PPLLVAPSPPPPASAAARAPDARSYSRASSARTPRVAIDESSLSGASVTCVSSADQPFGPQRRLDRGPGRDARMKRDHVLERRKVDLHEVLPVHHHEEVRVRDGEALAEQERLPVEHLLDQREALLHVRNALRASFVRPDRRTGRSPCGSR